VLLVVSACLLGFHTRYDGTHNQNEQVRALAQTLAVAPVCPEQLGGLPTPRLQAEIIGGDGHDVLAGRAKVVTAEGEDRTDSFLLGAGETLKMARAVGAGAALFKAGSPSCGKGSICDGTFSGVKKPGFGVTAALLAGEGIHVFSEDDLKGLAEYLRGLKPGISI